LELYVKMIRSLKAINIYYAKTPVLGYIIQIFYEFELRYLYLLGLLKIIPNTLWCELCDVSFVTVR